MQILSWTRAFAISTLIGISHLVSTSTALAAPSASAWSPKQVVVDCMDIDVRTAVPVFLDNFIGSDCASANSYLFEPLWLDLKSLGERGAATGAFKDGLVRVAMRKGAWFVAIDADRNAMVIGPSMTRYFEIPPGSLTDQRVTLAFSFEAFEHLSEKMSLGDFGENSRPCRVVNGQVMILLWRAKILMGEDRFASAITLLDQGIALIGDDYVRPDVVDDTGQILLAAEVSALGGKQEVAANLKARALEGRLEGYTTVHRCSSLSPASN